MVCRVSLRGNMFRHPLRRDPLVVGWAIGLLASAIVALSRNTTWSGHLEAARVAGFLRDLAAASLLSLIVLWSLALLRSLLSDDGGAARRRAGRVRRGPAPEP